MALEDLKPMAHQFKSDIIKEYYFQFAKRPANYDWHQQRFIATSDAEAIQYGKALYGDRIFTITVCGTHNVIYNGLIEREAERQAKLIKANIKIPKV